MITTYNLEKYLKNNNLSFSKQVEIDGSNIDYVVDENENRVLILVRDVVTAADINYLNGVGRKWDKKIAISYQPITNEIYKIGNLFGISLARDDELSKLQLFVENEEKPGRFIELIEALSDIKWGSRLIIIFAAGWKELLAIFIFGFFSAILFQESLFPLISVLLHKIGLID